MIKLWTVFNLAPAPLFVLGFIWELTQPVNICGGSWSMPAMWAIMALAHLTPWLLWWQQRNFTRN